MSDKVLQDRAVKIIRPLIPPDSEDRVKRAVKQWNAGIREHIRTETGLKLSDKETRHAIPVKVVEGFPLWLARLIDQHQDPVLWRLIMAQPRLGAVIDGIQFLLEGWDAFERWPLLPSVAKGGEPHLRRTVDIAVALQQLALTKKVREQIKEIDKDILGAYLFPPGVPPWVEIYWMPVAMVAAMLNVRIEDISLVALAHELTHGYTHIGRDIDGLCWDNKGFEKSDAAVVEGLAQFYTQVVAARFVARAPGMKEAYERFLEMQSGPYLAHTKWLEEGQAQQGETIRFTMLAARNRGQVKHDDWKALMADTRKNLRKRTAPKTAQPETPLFMGQ